MYPVATTVLFVFPAPSAGHVTTIDVFTALAGIGGTNTPIIVSFVPPMPASAVNTSIVVTCPALGAGNTNNTVVATGYTI